MTVRELIKELSVYNQDLLVIVDVLAGTYNPNVRILDGYDDKVAVAISGFYGDEIDFDDEESFDSYSDDEADVNHAEIEEAEESKVCDKCKSVLG